MSDLILVPVIEIIGTNSVPDFNPKPPTVVSAQQASGYVVVGARVAAVSGQFPPVKMRLYRVAPGGSAEQVYETYLSPTSLENLLFDYAPTVGVQYSYYATTTDGGTGESTPSNSIVFSAFDAANIDPFSAYRNITPSAFGPYPLLGNDFYVDPIVRDFVVGPNGDYLTVSGLECLAQDLRNHILTEVGELPLKPTFGFARGSIIGSGQGSPAAQAQLLQTRVKDVLSADPRVQSIVDLQITQQASDAWTITYVVQAIGVEDAAMLNFVLPYATGGTRSVSASAS